MRFKFFGLFLLALALFIVIFLLILKCKAIRSRSTQSTNKNKQVCNIVVDCKFKVGYNRGAIFQRERERDDESESDFTTFSDFQEKYQAARPTYVTDGDIYLM